MKELIDYIIELLEDFKDKEYIVGRDIVNNPTDHRYYAGMRDAYNLIICMLKLKLANTHDTTYDLALKQLKELHIQLIPLTKQALIRALKSHCDGVEFLNGIMYERHNHIEYEIIDTPVPMDSFESIAQFMIDNMEGTEVRLTFDSMTDFDDAQLEISLCPDYGIFIEN